MGYAFANTGSFILSTAFGIYIALVLLRLYMQLFRASFANPFANFIVKATNPLLVRLRRIIPSFGKIDMASLVLAFALHVAFILIMSLLDNQEINLFTLVLWSVAGIIAITLNIYIYIIIASVIASWVPELRHQPAFQTLRQLAEPVLGPFRRLLPDLGGIDISPIVPFFIIQILLQFMQSIPQLRSLFILGL